MSLKLNDLVTHTRRNGEKIRAKVVKKEYPGAKGSWVDIQPLDKKGENVGKYLTCRPSQVKPIAAK